MVQSKQVVQLFGVGPSDPATYIAAAALMLFVGTAAAFLPAFRATRVHPTQALNAN